MDADRLLDGLDPAQRRAVTSEAGILVVLAGAGSGKTRVLTRRIAHRVASGQAAPAHVLAVTFTRRAAGELRERLSALGMRHGVAAGTLHAVAWAQLRQWWADRGRHARTLLPSPRRVVAEVIGADAAAAVAAEIAWAKARLIDPRSYPVAGRAAGRRPPRSLAEVAAAYERYEHEKQRRGLVDFDDVLGLLATALESDRPFADAQRWRFQHLFVDEAQDLTPLQHRLVEAWRGGRADLCIVGDPHQAIYGFAGADPSYLDEVVAGLPGAEVIELATNHRSATVIVAAAGGVLGARYPSPDTPLDGTEATVEVAGYDSAAAEAAGIAAAALTWRDDGVPLAQQAVLARTNAQLHDIQAALDAAGVPNRQLGRAAQPITAWRPLLEQVAGLPPGVDPASWLADLEADTVVGLAGLLELAREYRVLAIHPTGAGFAAWAEAALAGPQPERQAETIGLATFHAAKGMEWRVVHLAGLEEGRVPFGPPATAEREAEERRLLYVAVTRARRHLRATWSSERAPSRWLAALEAHATTAHAAAVPPGPTPLALARAALRRAESTTDERTTDALLRALVRWRDTTARAASVPTEAVLDDQALAAIAQARPASAAELAEIAGLGPVRARRLAPELLEVLAGRGPS